MYKREQYPAFYNAYLAIQQKYNITFARPIFDPKRVPIVVTKSYSLPQADEEESLATESVDHSMQSTIVEADIPDLITFSANPMTADLIEFD